MVRPFIVLLLLIYGFGLKGQESTEYFQQYVAYDIKVELDDENHLLRGYEQLTYVNNSPDELTFIYFHIWPNAYSHRSKTHLAQQLLTHNSIDLYYADDEHLGWIDSLDFKVNGQETEWFILPDTVDVCKVMLPEPLQPGASIELTTPFKVKFPGAFISRLGHTHQSYQVTQWYPKPAVYDRNGWHQMPYLNLGEFYSEFGSYDVHITLPDNYIVGATGDLQNEKELNWLSSKAKETKSWLSPMESSDDFSSIDLTSEHPASSRVTKTLHYHQENVHDFAWFADKRFRVLEGEVELPHSKEKVTLWTFFTEPNARLWSKSIEYMHDAVHYYSLWNGDYPYKQASAVDGVISAGGGMEYPNVTVIGGVGGELGLETVIMHEVGHNWFYGILGSNERDFPWMDEGMNTYNEQRYLTTKYPEGGMFHKDPNSGLTRLSGTAEYELKDQHYFTYFLSARRNLDQPINEVSEDFSMLNYGAIVYSKTGALFNYLRHYLGDELMDQCMKAYFEAYKFKHPYPEDVKRVFEETTGKDLGWFFDHLLKDRRKIDFKIKNTRKLGDGKLEMTVVNQSGMALPFCAGAFVPGAVNKEQWFEPIAADTTIIIDYWENERVAIDPNLVIPETRRRDNYSRTKGLLKRTEGVNPDLLFKIEKPWTNQFYWAPAVNYNVSSGFMAGLAFYNSLLPVRRLNYFVAPLYSFSDQDVYGVFDAWYGITPRTSVFQNIDIGVSGKRFDRDQIGSFGFVEIPDLPFFRVKPYTRILFRPADYNSFFRHALTLSSVFTQQEQVVSVSLQDVLELETTESWFHRLDYELDYDHPVAPMALEIRNEYNIDAARSSITLHGDYFMRRLIDVRWRIFGGTFWPNQQPQSNRNLDWQLGGQDAQSDYAFDGAFLDRGLEVGVLSRQFMLNHGAFKTAAFSSQDWMLSANLQAKLQRLPFGVFGSAGYADFVQRTTTGTELAAEAGIYASIGRDILQVYFPFVLSDNLRQSVGSVDADLIRFSLHLNRINIFDLVRDLDIL